MFDLATLKDPRPIEGVADLATLTREPRPGDEERRAASFRRFHETFLASLGIAPRFALLEECVTNAMRPHFSAGDWLLIDGARRTIRSEQFYMVKRTVFEPRLVVYVSGGIMLTATNKARHADEFVSRADMPSLEVLGLIKGVIGDPDRR